MAMVKAVGNSSCISAKVTAGASSRGSEGSMAKRSPMVSMPWMPSFSRRKYTATVITTMATSEPGTRLDTLGVSAIKAMDSTPTPSAQGFSVAKCPTYTVHFWMKSAGTSAICKPKRSFICWEKMVSAMPLVKPTTTG